MRTGPTELELRILRRLWALGGSGTVHDVIEGWTEGEAPGYTTVLKILQIMERKGTVAHERTGRSYRYAARIRREQHVRSRFQEMLHGLLGPEKLALVSALVEELDLSEEEITEVRKMLRTRERRKKEDGK